MERFVSLHFDEILERQQAATWFQVGDEKVWVINSIILFLDEDNQEVKIKEDCFKDLEFVPYLQNTSGS